jgi:predicted lactoylglutathione lyase
VDGILRHAQAAAATIVSEPAKQPRGYTGAFADPGGDLWA